MTKNKTKESIDFQLRAIEILDYCLKAPKKQLTENPVFQFDINLEHQLTLDKNIIIVICSISILSENKEELLGSLKSSCIYEVVNLKDYFIQDTKTFDLPAEFIITINSVSISTSRGMMFSFFRGTFLHNAVLPMVKPTDFIAKKD